jgi:hypothetical protein
MDRLGVISAFVMICGLALAGYLFAGLAGWISH